MVGTSLGPYKIIEQIGAGGMGEVWLGEDTRLGRKVAIKVLPAEFASDPERLARFEQEARAAAALNHPHIAVVHDVGSEPGDDDTSIHFMVQEYLVGQSLRERMEAGALPLDKTLDLATEVGEALIAAHKAGIVHRDLKPDNIFVTEEGHAKVLDFGLAKLTEMAAPTGTSASMSPTMLGTVAGQVMGTAGYMAPEQINGEEIDHRADLFAFGCVLYGMVAGKQAFAGRNVMQTLDLILAEAPQPVGEIKADLPLKLQWILDKALAKDPAKRYQTAGDLVVDLRTLGTDVESGTAMPVGGQSLVAPAEVETARGVPWKLAVPVAMALVAATTAVFWFAFRPPIEPGQVVRFDVELPTGTNFTNTGSRTVSIAPDGSRVVFTAAGQLYVRPLDSGEAVPLRGTGGGASDPFFSPDGQEVGFWQGGQLRKVSINGGAALPISTAPGLWGVSWESDGTILYADGPNGIWRVSADGGEPEQVISVAAGESARGPRLLPGGERILFTLMPQGSDNWNDGQIVAQSLRTQDRVLLVSGGKDARYVSTGHLIYGREGSLLAVPFDATEVSVTGATTVVAEGVSSAFVTGAVHFDVSQTGSLVSVPDLDPGARKFSLVWVDREGQAIPASEHRRDFNVPRISPNGDRVAFEVIDSAGSHVWILDLSADTLSPLTTPAEGAARYPIWTPDGMEVTFTLGTGLVSKSSGFLGDPPRDILASETVVYPAVWSPDGKFLVYREVAASRDLLYLPLDEDGEIGAPVPFVDTDAFEAGATLSPDGKWLAYNSNISGVSEIYVRPFPGPGARVQISSDGGTEPLFSPRGNEIFYRNGTAMMVAEIQAEPEFSVLRRRQLFEGNYRSLFPRRAYEYDAESDRFLMLSPAGDADSGELDSPRINVVLNWFEELKERVPTGR